MITPEAARIVREVSAVVVEEQPEQLRLALCDILGVLIGHVLAGTEGDERQRLLESSLDMIEADIMQSYLDFLEWAKGQIN